MRDSFTLAIVGLLLAHCGGESSQVPGPDGGIVNPDCPVAPPADGTPCSPPLSCTYESGPHGACSVTSTCESTQSRAFQWSASKPGPTCSGNPNACLPSYSSVVPGASCAADGNGTTCDYSEGRCECVPCVQEGGTGSEWQCRLWTDVGAGCPTDAPPAAGSACSQAGLACYYSQLCGISFGPDIECENGKWTTLPMPAGLCAVRACGK